ncbi:MAG: ATP-binding protein [Chloroflexota bacterium]
MDELSSRQQDAEKTYAMTPHDETRRRQSQAGFENARVNLEGIFQTAREPLVVLDGDTRIQLVNRAFYNIFQVSESETLGQRLDELGNGQWNIPGLSTLLHEIVSQNSSFEDFEVEHPFPTIGLKTMLLNARQIEIDGHGTHLILLAIEDISARKQAENALEQKAKELARSNAELEQFAYVASHDLQEPLRMVASYVQLLARRYRGKLDQDADEFIGFAVDGASRMQVLINDLLAFSRVERKGRPFEPVDCERVLTNALEDLEMAIEQAEATITSDPLPTVMGDRGQLAQVFENLLSNAIKFHGDQPPVTHISAQREGDFWRFSVRDHGIGIEPQYWERIFLIFERLHDRTTYPGTGIGLAITKKIIERHGGKIEVKSELGAGTEFLFTLPAGDEDNKNAIPHRQPD